jgi:integrase
MISREDFERAAVAAISSRLSSKTKEAYLRALHMWLEVCSTNACDPANPRLEVASVFRDSFSAIRYKARDGRMRRYKTATVRDYLAALSFVYRRLMAQRPAYATWNPFDPEALAWPPASQEGLTEELPPEAAKQMIAAAAAGGALRDVAILHLLHATGARRISILTIRRESLHRRKGVLVARVQTKGSGGAELHTMTIPEAADEALREWLEVAPRSAWVFPGRGGASHLDLSMANKIVSRWGRAAGVSRARPHRFRVSFITEAFEAEIPLRDVQASAHHKDPRSTIRYDRGLRGTGVAEAVAKRRNREGR